MTALVRTYDGGGCAVYTYGTDTVIVTISTCMTKEMLWASTVAGRSLYTKHGKRVAALTIIETGAPMPGPELRQEVTRTVEEARALTLCAAQVLRGTGFWLSAVRSLLTAIELLRPGDLPRRVFQDVGASVRWMAGHLGHDQAWAQQLTQCLQGVTQGPQIAAAAH